MTSARDGAAIKAELRRRVLARRDALVPAERRAASEAVLDRVSALAAFRRAGAVLAYCSFGSELETDGFLRSVLGLGKALLLPRVDRGSRTLAVHRVLDPATDLRPGVWGIREPDPARCPAVSLDEAALVLVPGVAFDARGGRLGYGGGFYDRLLGACAPGRPALVAGAFEVQVVDEVPMGPGDRRVDLVVTERRTCPDAEV